MATRTEDIDAPAELDEAKIEAFAQQVFGDVAAVMGTLMTRVGDALGLWRALADLGPSTAEELAAPTSTHPRMIREWLCAQAAGGYVDYDPDTRRFTLPAEHAVVLAEDDSVPAMAGAVQIAIGNCANLERIIEAVRNGKGLTWGDHHPDIYEGTERFFGPAYRTQLTTEWIPVLDGISERLAHGGRVADIGCGHGVSTLLIAEAYPNADVVGVDLHEPSIVRARELAAEAGSQARFEVGDAQRLQDGDYDLICFLDCLHDMGDPVGAARRAAEVLASDGSVLLVEPASHDEIEDNLTPIGRMFYAGSTIACTPNSLHYDGPALGAQPGPTSLTRVLQEGGFPIVRGVAQTPANHVYEARLG